MTQKLNEWFGVSISEYQSSGHELDVLSVSTNGVKLMVEIIWTPTGGNFYRDMSIFYQSDAQIKVLIVNKEILSNRNLVREFQKARVSETEKGYTISPLVDGSRILSDENYLNTDVKNLIIDLISESRISIEIEVERLGEKLLSNEPISPILAKCIELSKRVEVNHDYVLWLKNELYGYTEYSKDKPEASEPEDFPNNPDYRKLHGELRAGFANEETRRRQYETFDKSVFLGQSVATIEGLIEDTKKFPEFLLNMPADPALRKHLKVTKVPLVFKSSDLTKCLQQLRLRLHRYLNEDLLPKIRQKDE